MIIDFHTHIFPPFLKKHREDYLARDTTLATLFGNSKAPMATAEELITAMDTAEVDKAIVLGIGWSDHELAQQANDYLLESAALYPYRLVPFCSVNPAWGEP